MKKTFFLINSLGYGGAERVINNVASELQKKQDVTILTLKKEKKYDTTVKVISLANHNSDFLMLLYLPIYYFKLKRIIKKNVGCNVISFLEISNFLNILANKNAIISLRTHISVFKKVKGKIYVFLIKKIYPKAKLIITNSEENTEDIKKTLNKKDVITIKNIVEKDFIKKLSLEKIDVELEQKIIGKRVFITIGRFDGQKRIDLLTETFSDVTTNKDVLLIIGDGPQRKKIEKIINLYKTSNKIILLGKQKNVFKYLKRSDFFILSSHAEGYPNVLLEANILGIPIITTDFKSGAREIMDSKLKFNEKIIYPYKGKKGYIIGVNTFKEDFEKLYLDLETKTKFKPETLKGFDKKNTIKQWLKLIGK